MSNLTFAPAADGRLDVILDGVTIGQVFRAEHTSSTTTRYAGKAYGYSRTSTSTRWAWAMADGMSNDGFTSRKAAVADMLDFA